MRWNLAPTVAAQVKHPDLPATPQMHLRMPQLSARRVVAYPQLRPRTAREEWLVADAVPDVHDAGCKGAESLG